MVDVYDVLAAFNVVHPAVAHAVKKQLAPGDRGAKNWEKDISEAKDSLGRALQQGKLWSVDRLPPKVYRKGDLDHAPEVNVASNKPRPMKD